MFPHWGSWCKQEGPGNEAMHQRLRSCRIITEEEDDVVAVLRTDENREVVAGGDSAKQHPSNSPPRTATDGRFCAKPPNEDKPRRAAPGWNNAPSAAGHPWKSCLKDISRHAARNSRFPGTYLHLQTHDSRFMYFSEVAKSIRPSLSR